jgi:hypothetical protein
VASGYRAPPRGRNVTEVLQRSFAVIALNYVKTDVRRMTTDEIPHAGVIVREQ